MQALLRAYMCWHVLPQMREKHTAEQRTMKCVFTGFGIMFADSCISFIRAWFEFLQIWTDGALGWAAPDRHTVLLCLQCSVIEEVFLSCSGEWWMFRMRKIPLPLNFLVYSVVRQSGTESTHKNIFKNLNHRHTFSTVNLLYMFNWEKGKIHQLFLIKDWNSQNIRPSKNKLSRGFFLLSPQL